MAADSSSPSYEELRRDVETVRSKGVGQLRGEALPALREACARLALANPDNREPAPIVDLLQQALDRLGDSGLYEAASYSLGLARGTALWSAVERRRRAAEALELQPETYRKKPEQRVLNQVTEAILEVLHDDGMRRARVDIEARRHPADSRLAVQWVERFEDYYRLWTPIYALQANLEAAMSAYHDEPADHLPWDRTSDVPYDPIKQARGYAFDALYNYAQFHLELKRFMNKRGGFWLLSDREAEQAVADAVYRITWQNGLPSEDEAWLRRQLADSQHEEEDHFAHVVRSLVPGARIELRWQQMVQEGADASTDEERAASQAWLTIEACNDYCRLIDEDWDKIADWYKPATSPRRNISGNKLYEELLRRRADLESMGREKDA